MRHAGQHRGPMLRRADALWIISISVWTYARIYACKLPWRLYPLVERDPSKRIWLDKISTPALKVQLGWTPQRTYARIRAQNCTLGVWTVHRMQAYTRACARIRTHEVWIQLNLVFFLADVSLSWWLPHTTWTGSRRYISGINLLWIKCITNDMYDAFYTYIYDDLHCFCAFRYIVNIYLPS